MKITVGKTYLVKKIFAVLQDSSDEDMQVYHHLDDHFEEVKMAFR